MYYKNTHMLECNVVSNQSNFMQSAKNFRRFTIYGALMGPKDTLSLYIFEILKTLLHTNGTFSKNLKAIGKELLDF